MKTIMTVDDSASVRQMICVVLRGGGYQVVEAVDGEDGLSKLANREVDLVLTDVNMPKMDGIQLLAAIKGAPEWRGIPVVMVTTEGGEAKVGEAVRLGAAGYVRKPFTADQIKEKLVGVLPAAISL